MTNIITTDGKNGVKLTEYKGIYQLTACYGEYEKWGKPQTGKDTYAEKAMPIRLILGDKDTALGVLSQIAHEITGKDASSDDIPF